LKIKKEIKFNLLPKTNYNPFPQKKLYKPAVARNKTTIEVAL
jgi:hypothetical protein